MAGHAVAATTDTRRQEQLLKAEEKYGKSQSKGLAGGKKADKVGPVCYLAASLTWLQQRDKLVQYEKQATAARNEYLLSLASCNAFKEKFYQTELSGLVDTMDQNFFDTMRHGFQIYHDRSVHAGTAISSASRHADLGAENACKEFDKSICDGGKQVQAAAEKAKFFAEFSLVFKQPWNIEFARHESDKARGAIDLRTVLMLTQTTTLQHSPETLPEMLQRYRELECKVMPRQARHSAVTIAAAPRQQENRTGEGHAQHDRAYPRQGGCALWRYQLQGQGEREESKSATDAAQITGDDAAMKSMESVAMYCDAYQRLTQRNCEREALASQLRVLGDALGPHKPAPVSPEDVDWQAGARPNATCTAHSLCPDDEDDVLGLANQASSNRLAV